jgi:hypothetical protein
MALDELSRPLKVIDNLFAQHLTQVGATGSPAAEFGERSHFQKTLGFENEECLAKIPCLNDVDLAESVPPFSLVRYRCLVQDVFEPEFYASVLQEIDAAAAGGNGAPRLVTSKYRECIEPAPGRLLQELDGNMSLSQRGACYCVPIPGERSWARSAAAEWTQAGGGGILPIPAATSGTSKRRRDDDVSMDPVDEVPQRPRTTELPSGGGSTSQADVMCQRCTSVGGQSSAGLKTAEDFGLNFPIPSEERHGHGASTACIVKLYDSDAETLRLCETIEVIGVLCVNPDIAQLPDAETGNMEQDWRDARHPSTSLIPRLHALAVRRLPFHHPLLPYTPDWLSEQRLASAFQKQFSVPGAMLAARNAGVELLSKFMGADKLAAEYLLMLLVSRSFSKHGEKLLGSWTLNVAGWPQSLAASALAEASGELVPRAVLLEVTGDTLNTQKWKPRKDFVANRLVASQLQLAAGTLVLLDESKMTEGQLEAHGVQSFQALQTSVTEQKLACDFQSFDVKIPLELSWALLSERKSLVKDIDVVVPLRVQVSSKQASGTITPEALNAARWLLALVTRSPRPLRIPDAVMHVFGEDFARVRQEFKVKAELAHTWMSLARARCLTYGEDELSLERWQEVMEMEKMRLLRCREDNLLEG